MKTARFTEVVAAAGRPAMWTSWTEPDKDKSFMRASREHRVMCVHQQVRGGKKDSGVVGLFRDEHTQFLVFPKSVGRFRERKIVGIDYDLVEQPNLAQGRKVPLAETAGGNEGPTPAPRRGPKGAARGRKAKLFKC
jgi:hypothetical protein